MKQIYAVITGDIVDSSKVEEAHYTTLLEALRSSFSLVKTDSGGQNASFEIFRGDGFQGIMDKPWRALHASLIIRANLRKNQPDQHTVSWDARTAVGIGEVDYLPENVSEGDGPAFRFSGPLLDNMKGEHRLSVRTPWEALNEELEPEAALLDAIIAKWTASQAEVVLELLRKKSRKDIARQLDISQAAVHYRVKGSGWFAIEIFLKRFERLIKKHLEN